MELFSVLFYIVVYLIEMLISQSFFSAIYSKRKSNLFIALLGSSLFITASFVFNILDNIIINGAFFMIINALFGYLCYNISLRTAFVESILLDGLILFTELITIMTFTSVFHLDADIYKHNHHYLMIIAYICKTLYFVCSQILALIIKKAMRKNINSRKFLPLFIFPTISIVSSSIFLLLGNEYNIRNAYKIAVAATSFLNVLACLFIFMYYETLESNQNELNELKAIEQKQEIDTQYMEILEQNNSELKVFTHDLKNHLEQISNLSDNPEIREYVAKLYGTVNQYSYAGMSDNKVLDVIIGKYNTLCQRKKIDISFDVKTANLSFIDNTDLSTILNNLLDNAVESAEKSREKRIEVSIFSKAGTMQILKISNTCETPPISENKALRTSKKNKELHGLGITSVKKVIKKYDGLFDWSYNERKNIFEAMIILTV